MNQDPKTAWADLLIATIIIGLLLAAGFYGSPAKGINDNPDCEQRFQKYKNIKCEVIK